MNMYGNWWNSTAQPSPNFVPEHPNLYTVPYGGFNHQYFTPPAISNNGQISYLQLMEQASNQRAPILVPSVDGASMNLPMKTDDCMEISEQKLDLREYQKVKNGSVNALPRETEDWTELTVEEDVSTSGYKMKQENENADDVREWIDLTELKIKKELKDATTKPSHEDCIVIDDEDTEPQVSNEESMNIENHEVNRTNELQKQPTEEETRNVIQYPPKELLKCEYCPYETEWWSAFCVHLSVKHKNIVPEVTEEETCLPNKEATEGKFHCKHCPYRTDWKSNLNKHIVSKHTTLDKIQWYECTHCSYKAKTKEYLRVHLKLVHEISAMWYKCSQCPYKTKVKKDLNSHVILNHTAAENIKWFKCTRCPYKAKIAANLRRHLANQHTDANDIKWYECDLCIFKTKTKKGLKNHKLSTSHCERAKMQQFDCNQCGNKLKDKTDLTEHRKNCPGKSVKRKRNLIQQKMCPMKCVKQVTHEVNGEVKLCKCKHCKP